MAGTAKIREKGKVGVRGLVKQEMMTTSEKNPWGVAGRVEKRGGTLHFRCPICLFLDIAEWANREETEIIKVIVLHAARRTPGKEQSKFVRWLIACSQANERQWHAHAYPYSLPMCMQCFAVRSGWSSVRRIIELRSNTKQRRNKFNRAKSRRESHNTMTKFSSIDKMEELSTGCWKRKEKEEIEETDPAWISKEDERTSQ